MKTVKTYQCECGEDFYEDDVDCLNCKKLIDKSKLKDEKVADIKYTNKPANMKYYLKRDLPTIKAGTEMKKVEGYENMWIEANQSTPQPGQYVPPEVLDEWIEESDGRWKPQNNDRYFFPDFNREELTDWYRWSDDATDNQLLSYGFVCRTEEEARKLAEKMLEAIKK